eukprot:13215838-Alexandrium_andersonii.AAC.1
MARIRARMSTWTLTLAPSASAAERTSPVRARRELAWLATLPRPFAPPTAPRASSTSAVTATAPGAPSPSRAPEPRVSATTRSF